MQWLEVADRRLAEGFQHFAEITASLAKGES